jgi:hypothetical protein
MRLAKRERRALVQAVGQKRPSCIIGPRMHCDIRPAFAGVYGSFRIKTRQDKTDRPKEKEGMKKHAGLNSAP